jgi:hypothetical protein
MNIIEFGKSQNPTVAFCIVDNTDTYSNDWIKSLIKNQSDYNIANITNKKYTVFEGIDEDLLIKNAAYNNFSYAVVISTGTEFINGSNFFDSLEDLFNHDFFLAGHILDRGDAYYELHQQCYVINLEKYLKLESPLIGQQHLGSKHTQVVPDRSINNIHDNYTPTRVSFGNGATKEYQHKCHGWNILSVAFNNKENVIVFSDPLRNNKKHFYPECTKTFNKEISWAYYRMEFCQQEFVHTANTEVVEIPTTKYDLILTPASGTWFLNYINDAAEVVFYDYNQRSLDYWKSHAPKVPNVNYRFVLCNLLIDNSLISYIDKERKTLVNFSNVLNYEATAMFYSLDYRLERENSLLLEIKSKFPNAELHYTMRACEGFAPSVRYGTASNLLPTNIRDLKKPTWHFNQDWQ